MLRFIGEKNVGKFIFYEKMDTAPNANSNNHNFFEWRKTVEANQHSAHIAGGIQID